ncbi:MAG: hypothetical protein J5797_09295 [Prevotella sp.]|nr:hypothetical protein [Prevotella sp.]
MNRRMLLMMLYVVFVMSSISISAQTNTNKKIDFLVYYPLGLLTKDANGLTYQEALTMARKGTTAQIDDYEYFFKSYNFEGYNFTIFDKSISSVQYNHKEKEWDYSLEFDYSDYSSDQVANFANRMINELQWNGFNVYAGSIEGSETFPVYKILIKDSYNVSIHVYNDTDNKERRIYMKVSPHGGYEYMIKDQTQLANSPSTSSSNSSSSASSSSSSSGSSTSSSSSQYGKLLFDETYTCTGTSITGVQTSTIMAPFLCTFHIYENRLFYNDEPQPSVYSGDEILYNIKWRKYLKEQNTGYYVSDVGAVMLFLTSTSNLPYVGNVTTTSYLLFERGDTRHLHLGGGAVGGGNTMLPQNGNNGGYSNTPSGQRCNLCAGTGSCSNPSSPYNSRTYCHGSGKCPICGGDGLMINTYSNTKQVCSSCRGNGRCQNCNGTGKCKKCGGSGHQ